MDAGRDTAGLELISKADAVLAILERNGEVTAPELAGETNEPLSSVYRLLQSLASIGWVERGSVRGKYRLGLYFMAVGGQLEDSIDIRESALPALRELLGATRATSYLCVRRGGRAVCIERLEGVAVRSLAMQLGGSLPLYAGAAPRALLAFVPTVERKAALQDTVRQPGDPEPPDPATTDADLALIRGQGYAVSDGDVTAGIAALGAPVFNHRAELTAAISISGIRAQILGDDREANIKFLLSAARAVSSALGYSEASEHR
jgi:DNA-binding IclR family transcriptional regulator